ncbi:hypothetical protein GPECTOR_48g409 [Gonium pectorale]|uniref:Peptidase M11 gametolysin domain-containing protein n=1 Tax=Gonium pectorale TaxID=33097 RepID=A0A150G809_GONPE|nr:hypothetical protein GPECTOR_48g409 [Gonium pectorale]|eukprot:KXZ45977.1 hypothetical protein GPECTOR_48g409 [Gonium pectorale]
MVSVLLDLTDETRAVRVSVYVTESRAANPYTYTLVELANGTTYATRVDFPPSGVRFQTGDLIATTLNYTLPRHVARRLAILANDKPLWATDSVLVITSWRLYQMILTLGRITGGQSFAPVATDSWRRGSSVAADLIVVNGTQLNVTSLAFLFQSPDCETPLLATISASRLRQAWYNQSEDGGAASPMAGNLQQYYQVCSNGFLRFEREKNLVFGPIDIPCKGINIDRTAYDMYNGDDGRGGLTNTFTAMWEAAERHLDRFTKAVKGCPTNNYGGCKSFIYAMTEEQPNVPNVFHELGHNIGLSHSDRLKCPQNGDCYNDYETDPTDPMGAPHIENVDEVRASSYPPGQAYIAGWATPKYDVNISEFTEGEPRSYRVDSMSTGSRTYIRLTLGNANLAARHQRAIYVSYRTRTQSPGGYDSGLEYDRGLWIHEYNDTFSETAPAVTNPLGLAMLSFGEALEYPLPHWGGTQHYTYKVGALGSAERLNITLVRVTDTYADVRICYSRAFSEATQPSFCYDTKDNDW